MPSPQRGPFITGLVSFRLTDVPTFQAEVVGFNLAIETAPIVRTKRGDVWRRVRQGTPGAGLILSGTTQYQGYPLPDQFKGVTGSVVLKYHQNAQATVQIRVLSSTLGVASKTEQDKWDVTFTCEVTAYPTLTGFGGAQVSVNPTPAYNAAETHEGVTKTVDPDGLSDVDTVRYDLDGLLDTSADETNKVVALLAAQAATRAGMKVRSAAFVRTDAWGGVVVITLMRTTTAEDVVNAGTVLSVDPQKLQTGGTVTAINNPSPTVPVVAGQTVVARVTSKQELNDGNLKYTTDLGQRTTAEDLTMPGTWAEVDPLGLDTQGQATQVYNTGALPADPPVPAGTQIVRRHEEVLNQDRSERVTRFDVLNSEQKRTFPKIHDYDDPKNIKDEAVRAQFWTVGQTPPALPDDPPTLNVKLVGLDDVPVSPTRKMRVWLYGPKSSRDETVLPNTSTTVDSFGLESAAVRAVLDGEDAPDTPEDMVARGPVRVVPLTLDLGVNRLLYVYEYGLRTTTQDVTFPETRVKPEPTALASAAQEAFVFDPLGPEPTAASRTITLPTDVKEVGSLVEKINQTKNKKIVFWGMRTEKEEIEWLQSRRQTESSQLKPFAVVAEVTPYAAPDAGSDNPDETNLSYYASVSHRLTDTQYVHLHEFRTFTGQEEAEEPGNETIDDPTAFLVGEGHKRQIMASGTPATPPTYAGRVPVKRLIVRVGKVRWQHDYWYDFRSTADKLVADRRHKLVDAGGLKDVEVSGVVWATGGGAPADPSPPAGLKLVDADDTETDNPAYKLRLYRWGKLTSKDEVEKDGSETHVDPGGLGSWQRKTLVNATPTVDAGFQLVDTGTRFLNDTDASTAVRGELVTTRQRVEHEATAARYDATEPARVVTGATATVLSTDTAASIAAGIFAANKASLTFEGVEVTKLNNLVALQKITETPAYLLYRVSTRAERRTVYAELLGGAVYVKLDRVVARGTNLYQVLIAPQTRIARTARLALRRKVSGDPLALFLDKSGRVNAAEFLGLPISTVLYVGRDAETNLAITGGRSSDAYDVFDYDSLGHFSTVGVIDGWFDTTANLSGRSDGDKVTAATFGWSEAVGTAATDLTAFMTP